MQRKGWHLPTQLALLASLTLLVLVLLWESECLGYFPRADFRRRRLTGDP